MVALMLYVLLLLVARVRTSERSQSQFISDLYAVGREINEKRGTSKPNENVIALQTYIFCFIFRVSLGI